MFLRKLIRMEHCQNQLRPRSPTLEGSRPTLETSAISLSVKDQAIGVFDLGLCSDWLPCPCELFEIAVFASERLNLFFHHAAWRLHRLILGVGDELFNCLVSWFPLAYLPATVICSLQTNQPHVGLVVRGPVGLVQKLVYVRCLDIVALLQLPHALHLL